MPGWIKTVTIFDYQISSDGLGQEVSLAFDCVKSPISTVFLACINPHSLVVASKDFLFRDALQDADVLIPDGTGIILAARLLNLPITQRVTGTDFFMGLSGLAEKNGGLKYFFLGSNTTVLERIRERLMIDFPSISICGVYSPPYKDEFDEQDNETMVDLINDANPDVLWVGMTAPKQEKWVFQNRHRLNVPFVGAIGAVFDFYAQTVRRPSPFWQKLGLEWLPRFLREPGRLWKRNLVSTPVFVYWVLKKKFTGKSHAGISRPPY